MGVPTQISFYSVAARAEGFGSTMAAALPCRALPSSAVLHLRTIAAAVDAACPPSSLLPALACRVQTGRFRRRPRGATGREGTRTCSSLASNNPVHRSSARSRSNKQGLSTHEIGLHEDHISSRAQGGEAPRRSNKEP